MSTYTQSPKDTIVKNAVRCSLCGSLADLHNRMYYQCQKNPNHLGDTWVGIFTDMSMPKKVERENKNGIGNYNS